MAKRVRAVALFIFCPIVLLAITACPIGVTDHILIDFGPLGPRVMGTFTFTAAVPIADRDVLVYKWNFGDGTMAFGRVVTHSYPGGGTYTVELIVSIEHSSTFTHEIIFTRTITVTGIVAFVDEDSFGDDAIFVINTDGTGLTQVTNTATLGIVDIDELDINAQGQIVYACEIPSPPPGADDDQICAINSDGTNDRILTSEPFRTGNPRVNEFGQVVYICEDAAVFAQLCAINLDGTGHRKLTVGSLDNFDPELNNLGQIAYQCETAAGPPQICVVNFDGSGRTQLTFDPDGFIDPELNDLGVISFGCFDNIGDDEICAMDFDGMGFAQLTDSDCCTDFYNPEMNQFGNIAFFCDFFGPPPPPTPGSSPIQSCVIDTDGGNFRVTPDTLLPLNVLLLDIEYSGTLIAAVCEVLTGPPPGNVEVCLYDDNAMFFTQLTSGAADIEDVAIR